jgi:hypothetical protein
MPLGCDLRSHSTDGSHVGSAPEDLKVTSEEARPTSAHNFKVLIQRHDVFKALELLSLNHLIPYF